MDSFQDKQLTCKDCGKEFTWTAGEQQFFAQKGFQNVPARCPDCRRAHKARQNDGGGQREMHKIVCSDCGKEGEVPFKPSNPDSPVYCADCFRNRKGVRSDRDGGSSSDNSSDNSSEPFAA